jgi:sigma-B regulation protein RsbU (phosphoserine phosphatase)
MNSRGQRSLLWVKVAISAGILLGLALLIQTITTYFFVYGKLISEAAYQEAERQQAVLVKLAAAANVKETHKLGAVLAEMERDSPRQIAWLRVLDPMEGTLALAGKPLVAAPGREQLMRGLEIHQTLKRDIASSAGKISVADLRFRLVGDVPPDRRSALREGLLPPPGERERIKGPHPLHFGPGRDPPIFLEVAIYQNGVSFPFGPLRQNLIIGCLAALALLASMILIGILFTRFLRARQLEQQIELARTVQTGLLPSAQSAPDSKDGVDFAAVFTPAASIGGDFYDIFTAGDGRTSLVLGDVAGKGISAALLMGVLHGAIRSLDWTSSAGHHADATVRLNHLLCERTARERFASLFWAYFTPETGVLHYINAGHLPPILVRADGCVRLDDGGPVLGLLPGAQFLASEIQVNPGDLLIVFSDGIAEAMNEREEEFGEERIAQIAQAHLQQHPRQICDAIVAGINAFLGASKPHDDQTLLIVRLTPVAAEKPSTLSRVYA